MQGVATNTYSIVSLTLFSFFTTPPPSLPLSVSSFLFPSPPPYLEELVHLGIEATADGTGQSITTIVHHTLDIISSQTPKRPKILIHLNKNNNKNNYNINNTALLYLSPV